MNAALTSTSTPSTSERQWSAPAKLRTILVDDHPWARRELRRLLEADPRLDVLGEAADGMEAIAVVKERRPDLVVMDLNLPKLDGIAATDYIKRHWPAVKVIGVSSGWGPLVRRAFLQVGADAVLNKEDLSDHLSATINSLRTAAVAGPVPGTPPWPPAPSLVHRHAVE